MSQYTFQFNDLAAYASAKASGGSIATALSGVSSTDISRSVVSYIKGIGQAVTDSVNLFVPYAKGGLAGDVLYYTGTEYCWLKSPSDALDGSVLGQNIINTSAIPTSWVRVGAAPTSESKDVQIGMQAYQPGAAMVKVEKLLGNSVVWNQLVANSQAEKTITGTIPISGYIGTSIPWGAVASHKYLFRTIFKTSNISDISQFSIVPTTNASQGSYAVVAATSAINEYIFTAPATTLYSCSYRVIGTVGTYVDVTIDQNNIFDLTLMFGESVANTMTVEMFEKLFPLSYYEYNAGEIISNEAAAVKGIGRNLWDGNHSAEGKYLDNSGEEKTGSGNISTYIPVLDGKNYLLFTEENIILGVNASICWYDGNKNFIAGEAYSSSVDMRRTTPTNAKFFRFSQTNPTKHYMFALSGPLDGQYEPYKESIAKLDAKKIYGKLNGAGNYVQVFPNGIRSAGTVYDEVDYQSKSAVVRVNSVDMGTLTYTRHATYGTGEYNFFYSAGLAALIKSNPVSNVVANVLCEEEVAYIRTVPQYTQKNRSIGVEDTTIYIFDSRYSSSTAAEFKTAMSGVELLYELATPKYYTDLKLSDDNGATFHDLPRPFYYTAGLEMKDPQDTASSVTAPARLLAQYKPIKK